VYGRSSLPPIQSFFPTGQAEQAEDAEPQNSELVNWLIGRLVKN